MNSKIKEITQDIERLNKKLGEEYSNLGEKYGYSIAQKEVEFLKGIVNEHKGYKIPTWKYVIPTDLRHLLSMPFIYGMIIPGIILDLFLSIYHAVAFRLYRIPRVRRSDYIMYDRKFLSYLNIIQKINCLYCSYLNGLFGYAVEIAARTERYWCPVKAAEKPPYHHAHYKNFSDYGNPEGWNKKFNTYDNPKEDKKTKTTSI